MNGKAKSGQEKLETQLQGTREALGEFKDKIWNEIIQRTNKLREESNEYFST